MAIGLEHGDLKGCCGISSFSERSKQYWEDESVLYCPEVLLCLPIPKDSSTYVLGMCFAGTIYESVNPSVCDGLTDTEIGSEYVSSHWPLLVATAAACYNYFLSIFHISMNNSDISSKSAK